MSSTIKKTVLADDDINNLENKLGSLLSTRQANPEFVQHLRFRLTTEPMITVETRKRYTALLIMATALFSGSLIIFIISLISGKPGKTIS